MTTSTEAQEQVVTEAIKGISHIATLPEITLRIIELVENPRSTAHDLHEVIANDPALCSRILKVVNSAFYGLPGQIGSINRAIVLLGLNAVKNIAIAASLAKLFRGGELCPNFSARDLWKHSIASAAASKLVADVVNLGLPDEAFLGGLIHDIGVMVEMQHDRHKLIEVFDALDVDKEGAPAKDMLEIEATIFGATHQDFGKALCAEWKFPQSFAYITGFHHNPLDLAEEHRTLACVVHIADRIAAQNALGFRLDVSNTDISGEIMAEINLTPEKLERVRTNLPEHLDAVESLLS